MRMKKVITITIITATIALIFSACSMWHMYEKKTKYQTESDVERYHNYAGMQDKRSTSVMRRVILSAIQIHSVKGTLTKK